MSMTPETPTPETDALSNSRLGLWSYNLPVDFSRKLERERDAARAEIEAMRAAIRETARHLSGFLGFHAECLSLDQVRVLSATLDKLKPFIPDAHTPQP